VTLRSGIPSCEGRADVGLSMFPNNCAGCNLHFITSHISFLIVRNQHERSSHCCCHNFDSLRRSVGMYTNCSESCGWRFRWDRRQATDHARQLPSEGRITALIDHPVTRNITPNVHDEASGPVDHLCCSPTGPPRRPGGRSQGRWSQ